MFSVASADDPAVPIVEQLMKEYETVDSRLIIGTLEIIMALSEQTN